MPVFRSRTYSFGILRVDRLPVRAMRGGRQAAKSTLGGWELSGIVTAETGLLLWITLGGSQGSNGCPTQSTNRPGAIGALSYPQTVTSWFDRHPMGRIEAVRA